MSSQALVRSKRLLQNGVGRNTQRDRVLPGDTPLPPIPARIGSAAHTPTSSSEPVPACVGSDWWTYDQPYYQWRDAAWHTDLDELVTSDGIWRCSRQQMQRISFRGMMPSMATDPLHLCFASPTVSAAFPTGIGQNDIAFLETGYSYREWHPPQTVNVFVHGLIGCAQRLKSIQFRKSSTNWLFRWNFKTELDPPDTSTPQACLNRLANETSVEDRVFAGGEGQRKRLKKFSLVTPDGQGSVEIRASPYGFLPATTRSDVALLVDASWASESNYGNMTDLSRLLSVGQGYHGVCERFQITDQSGGSLPTPTPYASPRYQNTRYFKHPNPPGTPAPALLPPNYSTVPYAFLDDAVLGSGLDYAPGRAILPTVTSWLHVDDQGVVRVLDLILVDDTATTTTWDVIRYRSPPGSASYPDYDTLGQIAIDTADPTLRAIVPDNYTVRTYTGSRDYQIPVSNADPTPREPTEGEDYALLQLQEYIQTESSPDGRTIVVMRGIYNPTPAYSNPPVFVADKRAIIATVASVEISPLGVVGAPIVLFDFSATYASQQLYWQDECHGFAFRADGSLWLWLSSQAWDDTPNAVLPIPSFIYNGTQVASADLFGSSSQIRRMSNNLLFQKIQYWGTPGPFGRPIETQYEFAMPGATTALFATAMPNNPSNRRYASWNPRTGQLACRSNPSVSTPIASGVGPITWT